MFFSFTKSKPLPYGELIGTVNIDGIELELYSNHGWENKGNEDNVWLDLKGEYLGYKYHCVSLVRRYLYFKTGKNYASIWSEGDAKDWYENAEKMNLDRISNTRDLQVGDLVCFTGGKYDVGHIAFVREKFESGLVLTHQNIDHNINDLNHCMCFEEPNFYEYTFQGGLRVQR